jgi:hypothetical protein
VQSISGAHPGGGGANRAIVLMYMPPPVRGYIASGYIPVHALVPVSHLLRSNVRHRLSDSGAGSLASNMHVRHSRQMLRSHARELHVALTRICVSCARLQPATCMHDTLVGAVPQTMCE